MEPPPLARSRSARASEPLPNMLAAMSLNNSNASLRQFAMNNFAAASSSTYMGRESSGYPGSERHPVLVCNSIDDFNIGKVLGTGVSSVVRVATHKATGTVVALKELDKGQIEGTEHWKHFVQEKNILATLKSPFHVALLGAFTTTDKVYLVLEYVSGGELFGVLDKKGAISENKARFYACQILLAIEYLHSVNIAYRDLKLENILLRETGDVIVTDYGFAKQMKPNERSYTLCGTPGYAAPEVLNPKKWNGHTMCTDWWSYGVLLFEMVSGYSPYDDGEDSLEIIYERIMANKIDYPKELTPQCRELISKLLIIDPEKRLGAKGAGEIKQHPWFHGVDWNMVAMRQIQPPFLPKPTSSSGQSSSSGGPRMPAQSHIGASHLVIDPVLAAAVGGMPGSGGASQSGNRSAARALPTVGPTGNAGGPPRVSGGLPLSRENSHTHLPQMGRESSNTGDVPTRGQLMHSSSQSRFAGY